MTRMDVQAVLEKGIAGERLSPAEGLQLLNSHDLASLGRAANEVALQKHPETYRTYNIDRNINYTNICSAVCDFCAFYRPPNSDEGYLLDRKLMLEKIRETVEVGGDQILLQGGLHPKLPLEWYEEMLQEIKQHFPQINIHGRVPACLLMAQNLYRRP